MPFELAIFIIFLMLACNAVFAAYEIALASIPRAKLMELVSNKRKGAIEAAYMKDRMEASLAVIQLGITLCGAIAAAFGGAEFADWLSPHLINSFGISQTLADFFAIIFLIIPLSCLTIILGELVPKTYALNNKVWVCLTLSPFMKGLSLVGYPVVSGIERIVKWINIKLSNLKGSKKTTEEKAELHELIAAVSMARTARLIGAREEKIVMSAAQLSTRPVKEIMLPSQDISMIPISSSLSDALVRAHLDMHTRFPVCTIDGDAQTIQGYINFKDIVSTLNLNPTDPTVKGIARPIKAFNEDLPISQVLENMMQEKLHIALVNNRNNKIVGMIALEDIIEELIGDIEDEYDRLPNYTHPFSGGWIFGGGVQMLTIYQTVGFFPHIPSEELNMKLAEWCKKKFRSAVKGGAVLEADGLQILVRKLRRKKISEAVVQKQT
jgi:putative hemolysin